MADIFCSGILWRKLSSFYFFCQNFFLSTFSPMKISRSIFHLNESSQICRIISFSDVFLSRKKPALKLKRNLIDDVLYYLSSESLGVLHLITTRKLVMNIAKNTLDQTKKNPNWFICLRALISQTNRLSGVS